MDKRELVTVAAGVLVAAVALDVRPARACSCPALNLRYPADGAVDVAVNTRLFFDGAMVAPGDVTLTGPAGAVAVKLGVFAGSPPVGKGIYVATPVGDLAVNTDYVFGLRNVAGPIRFRTGAVRDDAAPAIPMEVSRSATAGYLGPSDCGDHYRIVNATVSWQAVLLLAHVSDQPAPPPAPELDLATRNLWLPPYAFTTTNRPISLGEAACTVWPRNLAAGWIWYGALDAAGNFSGWSTATPIALPALPASDAGVEPDGASIDASPLGSDAAAPPPDTATTPAPTAPARGGGCAIAFGASGSPGGVALLSLLLTVICGSRRRAGAGRVRVAEDLELPQRVAP